MVENSFSFPAAFIERTKRQCATADLFFESLLQPPPVSIRFNPAKSKPGADLELEKVSWCREGFYLDKRPSFTHDPLFHAGSYFVQEASSMFLEQFILQTNLNKKPVTALDLCASPGGKSTHLISLLHKNSILVSNETIRSRIPALKENLIKWGFPNTLLTNNDPSAFAKLPEVFDLIICDAPCSGEGMFRKDPAAINHWSEAQVHHCAERQNRIVQQAWKALKPGGIFIYSTCTFNKEENENVLQSLIQSGEVSESIRLNTENMGNIEVTENPMMVYRFYPHQVKGEGITMAGLRKASTTEGVIYSQSKNPGFILKPSKQVAEWLNDENGKFFEINDMLIFLDENLIRFITDYGNLLNIRNAGTEAAELKGREWIPAHASCMSIRYQRKSFPEVELTPEDALRFLRGETSFTVTASEGILLFTHRNVPLGFARKTGNRFNNHYPKGWRIRKEWRLE